jgi:hypothetical protein
MLKPITIIDTNIDGKIANEIVVEIENYSVTIAEIIKARINQEAENYNGKLTGNFKGLVKPTNSEVVLNGYRLKKHQIIDSEKQLYIALDAFQKNQFFILVDEKQADKLDERIKINKETKISFIKLVPLVGG